MILHRTPARQGRWRSLTALTLLLGMWGFTDLGAREEGAERARALPIVSDSKAVELLRQAAAGEVAGARRMLAKKEVLALTPDKVVELVLGGNLTLEQQRHQVEAARHGIDAADAAFWPVVNLSITYKKNRNFSRKEKVARLREQSSEWFEVYVGPDGKPLADQEAAAQEAQRAEEEGRKGPDYVWGFGDQGGEYTTPGFSGSDSCITVDGQTVNSDMDGNGACGQDLVYSVETEYASSKSDEWANTWSGMAKISKLFIWGGSVNAQVSSTYLPPYKFSKSASVGALEAAQELGFKEWYSSATVGFRSPLPFAKNFGNQGNFPAVQSDLARLGSQRAELLRDVTTNTVLNTGLQAYWELVRSLLQVDVAGHYRHTMAKNLDRSERLFAGGQATEYTLLQAKASLENGRDEEEIAWNNVVIRQNNLSEILNLPAKVVVVPEGFEQALADQAKIDGDALLEKALKERPEILAAKNDLNSQDLLLAFRKNQLLPDLTFNASLNVGQSTAVFAYDSFNDSLTHLTSPDSLNYFLGFSLNIPWGNNKARSEYSQARASHTQAMDNERLAEVRVAKEANSALAGYRSALSREKLARTNLNLAKIALESAERQAELGFATDFELIQRNQEVFNAQADYVNALLDQRVTHVNLLAASGDLGRAAMAGGLAGVGKRQGEGGQP